MASKIGLPNISVEFKNKGKTAFKRGNSGVVALILKDSTNNGLHEVIGEYDIPSSLSEKNKKYIKLALIGNIYKPQKVYVYVLSTETQTSDALEVLETLEFNILSMPSAIEEDKILIKQFASKMDKEIKYRIETILNTTAPDNEYVINLTQGDVTIDTGDTLTADEFCTYVAGFIVGTPLSQSITYAIPSIVTKIPPSTKALVEDKIKNGELVLVKDAGAIRFARGVNSLVTTSPEKGEEFQKIKLVSTMNLIYNDIRRLSISNYVGKMPNSYDNKCLLITNISLYLSQLAIDDIIGKDYKVEIDIEAQTKYLKENNYDVSTMSEQEIKEANTKDKVFLKISVYLIDAMEDISVAVEI
ncbi:phage tail sheath C-terminal domain-containing protein (plasmid) [Paraclostridium ghonii]|uniref:phage tail sheath C-terminal domain-containing protein n=1 Tax=Paraclostridium ghonii TaxID=29358 RepID=UPI00202D08F6|nr:phage tail sheath C-terminal domain-containing protein [Paeniclostridium ghonii]MCM0167597.1 phage tail sheath subtilisin-like domain-containing protein [Paeniclostridium ghonii]